MLESIISVIVGGLLIYIGFFFIIFWFMLINVYTDTKSYNKEITIVDFLKVSWKTLSLNAFVYTFPLFFGAFAFFVGFGMI